MGERGVDLQHKICSTAAEQGNFGTSSKLCKLILFIAEFGRSEQKQIQSTWVCVKIAENACFRFKISVLKFSYCQELGKVSDLFVIASSQVSLVFFMVSFELLLCMAYVGGGHFESGMLHL